MKIRRSLYRSAPGSVTSLPSVAARSRSPRAA
jgi:hypothetical protein